MENFRIESLEINKIGAFEHIKMDFPKKTDPDKAEIHILTGENGTGKTTVLECLAHSTFIINNTTLLRKFHDFDSSYNIEYNNNNSIKIDRYEEELYHSGIQPFLKKIFENLYNSEKPEHRTIAEVNFSLFAYSGYRRVSETKIEGPKSVNVSPFKNSLDFDKSVNAENLMQWIVNTVTSELNAKARGEIQKAEKFRKSLQKLEDIINKITLKKISIDIDDSWNVLIKDEFHLLFDVLPDGLKSMISWIGDLLMRMDRIKWKDDLPIFERNFILFLDEIEVHLHPAWQRKILPVIQENFKNAQIFISTHSPFVVGSVDGAWVHKLKKDGAFAVLDEEPVLSEDAESYDTILEEVFGVKERFGIRVEEDLKQFYQFKSKILNDENYDFDGFLNLVSKLASESIELESMLGMELKQIKRLTGKDFLATV
jgi:predicted ATP-binding protein involved in virulence